jgi:hypothetical protein
VTEHDIEVIGAEPVEAHIDALGHAFGGEIEVLQIIPPKLGADV